MRPVIRHGVHRPLEDLIHVEEAVVHYPAFGGVHGVESAFLYEGGGRGMARRGLVGRGVRCFANGDRVVLVCIMRIRSCAGCGHAVDAEEQEVCESAKLHFAGLLGLK